MVLLVGSAHFAFGQADIPIGVPVNGPTTPRVDNKRLKSSHKLAAIEQAIKDGNEAYEESKYVKAFSSYRLVAEQLNPRDPRAVYGLGNVYYALGCDDQAAQAYAGVLRLDPNFHQALIGLGYLYIIEQRFDDAEARFNSVLKKAPQDAAAKIGLAYTAGKRKQYDYAVKQFHLIITTRTINSQHRALAYLHLGDLYLEQKKWAEASINFNKALEHNPRLASAYAKLGQAELFPEMYKSSFLAMQETRVEDRERIVKVATKAAQYVRTAVNEHRYNPLIGNLLLAQALLNQFNYSQAVNSIKVYQHNVEQLEKDAPSLATNCNLRFEKLHADGHLWLALIYYNQATIEKEEVKRNGFFAHVIENTKKLIELRGDEPIAYSMLGQIAFLRGDYAEAIPQLETANLYEKDDDSKGRRLELIGLSYEQLRHDQEAVRSYEAALKLLPNSPLSRLGLARVKEKNGDFDESIRLKKEALELTPSKTAALVEQLASSYFYRARQQNKEADYEEAIKLLDEARVMNPSYSNTYLTLGSVYRLYKKGADIDKALANYRLAERYAPRDAVVKFLIGNLYYTVKKNYEAAISYLEESIKLKPDYALAHRELGLAYRDKKDDNQAIKHLKQALSLDEKELMTYLDLADIYERQKNLEEAIKIWLSAADKLPLEHLPYKELARLYSYQQKNEEAIRKYQEAISRLTADQEWFRDVLRCRIVRLRGQFGDSITCVQNIKVPTSGDPAQIPYEIGLTHVASKNKEAALTQYEELKRKNSNLAEHLLKAINEMK